MENTFLFMLKTEQLQLSYDEFKVLSMKKIDELMEMLKTDSRREIKEKLICLKRLVWEWKDAEL